jgi:hypothetical protein
MFHRIAMGDDLSQLVSASLCVLAILSEAKNLYLFLPATRKR